MIYKDSKSIEQLKTLKHKVDDAYKRDSTYAIYEFAKSTPGWHSAIMAAIIHAGIIQRVKTKDNRKYIYEWAGGEPSFDMIDNIKKVLNRRSNEQARARNARKKAEKEKEKAKEQKPSNEKLEPTNEEIQDRAEESKHAIQQPEPELNQKAQVAEIEKPKDSPKIPISVDVTTEGDKKTVTIKIEV